MKGLRLFKTKKEYDDHMFRSLFQERLIVEHPFYRNLIQFVLDAKAPIVYFQTDPSERTNFSIYYNFLMFRETYANPTLESMYILHEFAHMLFYYPYDMASVTPEEFDDAVILGEYAASNESEVLLHYRLPALRPKVFQDRRIFADLLKERGVPQPTPQALFQVRKLVIETDVLDAFLFPQPADWPIRDTFKTYTGNRLFCKERYLEGLKLTDPDKYFYKFLTRANYERVISGYKSATGQEEYERTILMNMRLAWSVLGLREPPATFAQCFESVKSLEGQVMFKKA